MGLQLQQEDNHFGTNWNDDEHSHRRNDHRQPKIPKETNSDLFREMRKKMDELRSAIREKTYWNLDGMVRRTDSPFFNKGPRMPNAFKVSSPAARII